MSDGQWRMAMLRSENVVTKRIRYDVVPWLQARRHDNHNHPTGTSLRKLPLLPADGAHEALQVELLVLLLRGQVLQPTQDILLTERCTSRILVLLLGCRRRILLFGGAFEEIQHELRVHRRETRVLLRDDRVGDVELEALQTIA